ALVLVGLAPAVALAAGGGHGAGEPHINWWTWDMHAPPIGWFIFDFIVFVFLLVRFTRKPLRATFEKRHHAIKSAIADNEAAYARAKAQFDESRQKLGAVDSEVQSLIAKIKEDGAFERDRIVGTAREYASR